MADDSQLNNVVSLKKIAPYRRQEKVENDILKFQKTRKKKLRDFRIELISQVDKDISQGNENGRETDKNAKKLMNKWISAVKAKRTEGLTEADKIEIEKKIKREKRKDRALLYEKSGNKSLEVVVKKQKTGDVTDNRKKSYH